MGGQEGEASDANPKGKPCVLLLHHAKDTPHLLLRFDLSVNSATTQLCAESQC